MKITYRVAGLDAHGDHVLDQLCHDMIVEAHRPTLLDAFAWAETTLAADERVHAVHVRESIQDEPGRSWRAGAWIATLERAPRLTTALAVARVVDTVVRATLHASGCELDAASQRSYLPVVEGLVCWTQGERRVLAYTPPPGDYPHLHDHVAAEALDMAFAAVDGSPYTVPDTAVIGHVTGRVWDMRW